MRTISTSNTETSQESFEKRKKVWKRQFLKRIYAFSNLKENLN
jgi:hypothetical protein